MTNTLYYGDNLDILRQHVPDESVDLVYLDPPFNSNANYNVLFKEQSGEASPAQIRAFTDTWEWTQEAERTYEQEIITNARHARQRQGHDLRLPPVHRQQRDDGLPGHDDALDSSSYAACSNPPAPSTCTATQPPAITSSWSWMRCSAMRTSRTRSSGNELSPKH